MLRVLVYCGDMFLNEANLFCALALPVSLSPCKSQDEHDFMGLGFRFRV